MDRKLLDYLPPFLQEYNELKILTQTEQPEIEAAWKAADNLLQQPFVISATEYGIGRIEKIIGIHPYDTDDLETRKFRVLMKLREMLPYTYRTVNRYLGEMCEGIPYQFQIDVKHYLVTAVFELGEIQKLRELYRYLDRVIPCNLMIDFTAKQVFKFYQEINYRSRMKFKSVVYPRANIPYLYYDGTAKYDGMFRYNKYRTNENIQLYPIKMGIKSEITPQIFYYPKLLLKNSLPVAVNFETKINYKKEMEIRPKITEKLKITKEHVILPHYQIRLKIGKHPNRYNGMCRYDGKSQHYVEHEEVI